MLTWSRSPSAQVAEVIGMGRPGDIVGSSEALEQKAHDLIRLWHWARQLCDLDKPLAFSETLRHAQMGSVNSPGFPGFVGGVLRLLHGAEGGGELGEETPTSLLRSWEQHEV